MKHVIIGAGVAGIKAAETLRKIRPNDEIVMLSADVDIHSRCMLHNYIGGERTISEISFISEDFFEVNRVEWKKGVTVLRIDTAAKTLITTCGNETFDKLLIATGADSAIPPVGALRSADNVYGLRNLSDAQAIREKAREVQNILIIGAGLVGLDAAYALIEMGKKPTIIEMETRVLPLNLDPEAAGAYQKLFEDHGCVFRLGCRAIDTVSAGDSLTGVVMECGDTLPCDMVIVATGVRPAVRFLDGSGISVDRAISVDERMRTSAKDIYAAGDVTGLSGIWPSAAEMGEVAAKNMAGEDAVYEDTFAAKNTLSFFGLATLSAGALEPEEGDEVLTRRHANCYNKWITRDGVVKGVILQGNIAYSGFWQYLIKNRIKVEGPVWKASYADYYSVTETGEFAYA